MFLTLFLQYSYAECTKNESLQHSLIQLRLLFVEVRNLDLNSAWTLRFFWQRRKESRYYLLYIGEAGVLDC